MSLERSLKFNKTSFGGFELDELELLKKKYSQSYWSIRSTSVKQADEQGTVSIFSVVLPGCQQSSVKFFGGK